MNHVEQRLRRAGRGGPTALPEIETIMERGHRIRRNRRLAVSVASLALVGTGVVAAATYYRQTSPTEVIAAGTGPALEQDEEAPPVTVEPTVTTVGAAPPDEAGSMDETEPAGDDLNSYSAQTTVEVGTEAGLDPPTSDSVSDGSGGWLTVTSAGIEHRRVDGEVGLITFPDPPGGFAQRWPTDVARIGDRYYLLIDQFVNRSDLAAERIDALAERYGVPVESDSDVYDLLGGVANPEELSALEHWEVSILAVDLSNDQTITVETRVMNSAVSPDWIYNGHITSDGSSIMVMRELWQGHCLYAEGLTLDGEPVDIAASKVYAKPLGVDSMTYDEIDAVFSYQALPPQPCQTLEDLPDSGLGIWSTQADPDRMAGFRRVFYEQGLG